MIHVNKALSAIKKLELLAKYETAQEAFGQNATSIRHLKSAMKRAEAARTGMATPELTTNPESTTTTQSMTTSTTGTITPKTLSALEVKAVLSKALLQAGNTFFSTYEMMLADQPKHIWEKIVRDQTESGRTKGGACP